LKDVALEEIAPEAAHRSSPNPMDHWPPAILLERAAYLKKVAKFGDGAASETLREYPRHVAMLSFRSRDSEAEMNQNVAVLFCVLAGAATLVSGGTLTHDRVVEPGVTRGNSIENGKRQELKAGDIIHVPAGIPHQVLVAGEKTITCFVVQIQEFG
jgi:mannose-6-phosphate isomerase-like protein (cupin superfamily)